AAVVGDLVPDALRGLDLPGSRSAAGRIFGTAPCSLPSLGSRLHHSVPFPATTGGICHYTRLERSGPAHVAAAPATPRPSGGGCDRSCPRRSKHFLCTPPGSAHATTTALRHWLKWLAVVDLERQLIRAQSALQAPWNDCANLPELVARAHEAREKDLRIHGGRSNACRLSSLGRLATPLEEP